MHGFRYNMPPHIVAVLVLGAVSQVGQVLLLRELLMVFHGSELAIGLILASWMLWVGIGSRLGVFITGRINYPLLLLSGSAAGILTALPATILLIRFLWIYFDLPPGAHLSLTDMAVSCLLLMAPVCLLLGSQFVFLSRLWRESDGAADTSGAGKTYIGEAAGNMLGGLLFTFLLVHYLNAFQTAFFAGLLMIAAAYFLNLKNNIPLHSVQKRLLTIITTLMVLLAVIVFPFLNQLDAWAYRIQWRYFSPGHELVENRQSKHGVISVLQREEQYTFFQSGHLIFSTAGPQALSPGLEEQEAVKFAHLAMVQHPQPEHILLIGGGLRGTLSEIARHPVRTIDYIELDETLTATARPYVSGATLEALEDPRVQLIHTDARLFVKSAREQYDMIITDIPDPSTAVLNRFYTREFFAEAAELLNPGGIMVTGAVSTPDLRGTALANRNTVIYHTMNSVFSRVLPAGERFMFYFATDETGEISLDADTLQKRYSGRDIVTEEFSPRYFHAMLEEGQLRRVNWIVRNHGRSSRAHLKGPEATPFFPDEPEVQETTEKELPPVAERYFINSDFKPIGYYYTMMHWDKLTGHRHDKLLAWILHIRWWWILPFSVIPMLIVLALRIKAGRSRAEKIPDNSFAILFSVFTTGLSTMALQIALLFSFQSIYGFVYETVGLIVAIFMCGLSLGAFFTRRYLRKRANLNTLAVMQLIIALFAVAIAAVLPSTAALQYPSVIFILFSLLTFTSGLINGIDFPLSAACYMIFRKNPDQTAGIVYGTELFGACAGAVVASAVVAPVLGIVACCLLAAVANFTAFVVILLSRRDDSCLKENYTPVV